MTKKKKKNYRTSKFLIFFIYLQFVGVVFSVVLSISFGQVRARCCSICANFVNFVVGIRFSFPSCFICCNLGDPIILLSDFFFFPIISSI